MEIRINIGSDIMYVAGTINGVQYIFDNLGFGTFRTDVPVSDDDLYHFNLQLIDDAGNTSSYIGTHKYYLPIFIYDRTKEDIENRTKKSFINADDLNRIDRNTKLIGEYISAPVLVKTNWKMGDFPRYLDYQRIKENLQEIRNGYGVYGDTPQVPERPYNTFEKWNDIEKILHDVFLLYTKNYNSMLYCGNEFSCGDEIGVI